MQSLPISRVETSRSYSSATVTDGVLRRTRPTWAIKALLLHVFLLAVSILALFQLPSHLKAYPDWVNRYKPKIWRYLFYPLVRAYMENSPLAVAFQACFIHSIDMFCRVVILISYLLQWLYTFHQHHRRRSPIFADKAMLSGRHGRLGAAHRVVQIGVWIVFAVFWCFVLEIMRSTIGFLRSGDSDKKTDYMTIMVCSLLIILAVYLRIRPYVEGMAMRIYSIVFKTRQDSGTGVQFGALMNRIGGRREGQIRIE